MPNLKVYLFKLIYQIVNCLLVKFTESLIPGISVTAPIRRSTPWAFIRKTFPFVPTIEMSTLFSFPSKNQINAQGTVTENPGTSEKIAIDRYGKVIDTLTNSYTTHNIIIGTDQNFDYMKMNNNNNIYLLFDTFCSAGIIPVLDKPTRITHSSATCIDNIYVKCSPYEPSNAISGIVETDISDSHMPVFLFTGQKEKNSSTKGPLRFTCRPINEANIKCIVNDLQNHDWSMLQDMTVDIAYEYLLDK